MAEAQSWTGKVTVTAKLCLDYEFGDSYGFRAGNDKEAQEKALEMFLENIFELAYTDSRDLINWVQEEACFQVEEYKE